MGHNLKTTPPMNVTPIDALSKPLKAVRETVELQFSGLLEKMFDNADDTLFELAYKSAGSDDQATYFDAMREVRIKRTLMEKTFVEALHDGFQNLQKPDNIHKNNDLSEEVEASSLSLVQDDELEETLALKDISSRLMSQHDTLIVQLSEGIDSLVTLKKITAANNPIAPQSICVDFQQACAVLDLNINGKLVVYNLLDKFVLAQMGDIYEAANNTLNDLGINTDLKKRRHTVKKDQPRNPQKSDHQSKESSNKKEQDESKEQAEVFNFLRELLNESRAVSSSRTGSLRVAENGPALTNYEVAELLSSLQQQRKQTEVDDQAVTQPLNIRDALGNLISKQKDLPSQAIGRIDDDVINLISMLFEFILDDHHLPTPMKALIARLQIPMLKVAILDNTFFSRGGHPARRLLNELSTAAIGWNEAVDIKRDSLYKKVDWVVATVLKEFDANLDLFPMLLEEFTTFVASEQRRSELIEQRTRDAEEGLAKSKRAKAVVGKTLNELAAGKKLPPIVIQILRDGWSNYMFLVYVKEGDESIAWQEAVLVVKDLIWSVDGKKTESERRTLFLKKIPSLLVRLRRGLSEISFNKIKMRNLLMELEAEHLKCFDQDQPEASDQKPANALETDSSRVGHDKDISSGIKVGESLQQDEVAEITSDENQSDLKSENAESTVVNNSALIIDHEELEIIEDAKEDLDNRQTQILSNMGVGTWVELILDDSRKTRAKLAAIIRSTGKYIFVNRVGMKIAETTQTQLLADVENGVITILDSAMLFDRALESVIGHLREMKN